MGKKKKKHSKKHVGFDDICEDEDMVERKGSYRYSLKKESKKRNKQKKKERSKQKEIESKKKINLGWHTIKVNCSGELSKLDLLTKIGDYVEHQFQPLGYHTVGASSMFYLENNTSAADAIASLNRRLTGLNNQKLIIDVKPSLAPDITLDNSKLEILKQTLARRFNPSSFLLDLTCFHHDPLLLEHDVLAPLAAHSVLTSTMEIIRENVPTLKALNLSKNNLRVSHTKLLNLMKPLSLLNNPMKLSAIDLSHNQIGDRQVLKHVKIFPLEELNLEHNQFLGTFKDPKDYVKLVRKEIPSLKILDKIDIHTYISDIYLKPSSSESLNGVKSAITEEKIRTFLEQYYSLFDTDEKRKLVEAYVPTAKFVIQCHGAELNGSFEGLERINEALSNLPKFKHIQETFKLNILNVESSFGCVEILGECLLNDSVKMTVARKMKIIPFNVGLGCSEDLLELKIKT